MSGPSWGDAVGLSVFLALAIGMNAMVVLQWRGRLRSEDPDGFNARLYLLFPITLGFLVITLVLLMAYLDPRWLPGSILAGALVVSLFMMLFGVVLNIWRPRWLRPAWQRQQVAESRQRQGDQAVGPAGRYELEVVRGGAARTTPGRFDDIESAERAARAHLATPAGQATPTHVAIVDRLLDGAAVRIVEAD